MIEQLLARSRQEIHTDLTKVSPEEESLQQEQKKLAEILQRSLSGMNPPMQEVKRIWTILSNHNRTTDFFLSKLFQEIIALIHEKDDCDQLWSPYISDIAQVFSNIINSSSLANLNRNCNPTPEQKQFHLKYKEQCKKDVRSYLEDCQEEGIKCLWANPTEQLLFKIGILQLSILQELSPFIKDLRQKQRFLEKKIVEQEQYRQALCARSCSVLGNDISPFLLKLVQDGLAVFRDNPS